MFRLFGEEADKNIQPDLKNHFRILSWLAALDVREVQPGDRVLQQNSVGGAQVRRAHRQV